MSDGGHNSCTQSIQKGISKKERRIKDQILKLRTSTESIKEPDVS